MVTFTVRIEANSERGVEIALDYITRAVEQGYRHGSGERRESSVPGAGYRYEFAAVEQDDDPRAG